MLDVDLAKRQALIDLLSLPDTPDIRRGHRLTMEGHPDRFDLLPRLAASFVQQHMLEQEEHVRSQAIN